MLFIFVQFFLTIVAVKTIFISRTYCPSDPLVHLSWMLNRNAHAITFGFIFQRGKLHVITLKRWTTMKKFH